MKDHVSVTVPADSGALQLAADFLTDMAVYYGLDGTIGATVPPGPEATQPLGPDETEDAGATTQTQEQDATAGTTTPLEPEVELGQVTKDDPTLVTWDKRIHQDAKDKKYKGTEVWKAKKNLDPEVLAGVILELKATAAANGPEGPGTTDTTGGPGGPGGPGTTDGDEEITFAKLMQDFTAAVQAGKITRADEDRELPNFGLVSMPDLLRPECAGLIKPVYDCLAAIWNSTP